MTSQSPSAAALSQFQFQETRPLRVISIDGEPWFVAADVCAVLAINNVSQALTRLDDDERKSLKNNSLISNEGLINQLLNENQDVAIINESGLYSLILTSRKPEAKQFKKWVTAEVLPAIRKTGRYVAAQSQPPGMAPEYFTHNDMQNLTGMIGGIGNGFRFQHAMQQAIWKSLRAHTRTPAPQRFQVQHMPLIADELRRIYHLTMALEAMIRAAEEAVVKRILIRGENADKVLEEVRLMLAQADAETRQLLNQRLARWGEHEISRFVVNQWNGLCCTIFHETKTRRPAYWRGPQGLSRKAGGAANKATAGTGGLA